MSRLFALREKAKGNKKKIVLPEGADPRVVKAASILAAEDLANIYLLGRKEELLACARRENVSLDGVGLIDPFTSDKQAEVINAYFERRRHKGITREEAKTAVLENFVNYAAIMTEAGFADGFVAGASSTTSGVARAALQCLRVDRNVGTVSSAFIMELENPVFGEDGLFAYADCGIIPYPSAKQLTGIAIAASDLFKSLFSVEPRVAMLSFSTKGSAKAESIDAIRLAMEDAKKARPGLLIDGELQVDSAIVPGVAKIKCPDSPVAGKANVLIFPNLDAGNIAYKMTQRLGNAKAVGPIMLGLTRPCSDLSRGCSTEDIVETVVITAVRAQA